jgi:hypothetical protein
VETQEFILLEVETKSPFLIEYLFDPRFLFFFIAHIADVALLP